ncbi:MAG: hypothetical protein GXZ11_01360 [Tissierellia bacterium]|nr:hypothetical protein [Tissierellia bacterium]
MDNRKILVAVTVNGRFGQYQSHRWKKPIVAEALFGREFKRATGLNAQEVKFLSKRNNEALIISEVMERYLQEQRKIDLASYVKLNFRVLKSENRWYNESGHKGKDKSVKINKKHIYSGEYINKFKKLGESKELTQLLCKTAREILTHRDGTLFEDLAFVFTEPEQAGGKKLLVSNQYEVENQAMPTKNMKKLLSQSKAYTVIAIHNHPNNSFPSYNDIFVCAIKKYKYGLIVGHNGDLIKYTVKKLNIGSVAYRQYLKNILTGKDSETTKAYDDLLHNGIKIEVIK